MDSDIQSKVFVLTNWRLRVRAIAQAPVTLLKLLELPPSGEPPNVGVEGVRYDHFRQPLPRPRRMVDGTPSRSTGKAR
jgi:hypothetical protein